MAEANEDPREVAWHPRFAKALTGHVEAKSHFLKAFASGRPHHAWLLHGPKGIGKATLAYDLAFHILGNGAQSRRWIEGRAHPDLFVLERQLNDSKPRKLKSEISVEDARGLGAFLSRTASAHWRVVLIDAADDLNTESANAILKLVEEPPPKTLILLISHRPGRLLRTLRSRCLKLSLSHLSNDGVLNVINELPIEIKPEPQALSSAVARSQGSVGTALALLQSTGAKAFDKFASHNRLKLSNLTAIAAELGGKGQGPDEFRIFAGLLLNHVAERATTLGSAKAAAAYQELSKNFSITEGFNLDRKQAALEAMRLVLRST